MFRKYFKIFTVSNIYIYIYKNGLAYNVSADYNNNGNSDIDSDIIDKAW